MTPLTWLLVLLLLAAAVFLAALPWLIQPILRALLWPFYDIKYTGRDNVPRDGPALLAVNHVTWLDGFFLAAAIPRRGRALVNATYINWPVFRHLARWVGLIPIPSTGPKAQRAAITLTREALSQGEVVGLFPEAQLSRNGLTGKFLRGLELMLPPNQPVPVIPVYFDNLWGSTFSFAPTTQKRQRWTRRRVGIAFGPPIPPPIDTFTVRQGVIEAGVRAFALRTGLTAPPETLDPSLPELRHPELGLLAGSTADYDKDGVKQTGQKPGTLGQAIPGVALRAVDEAGHPLPADTEGQLQALLPNRPDWINLHPRARLDRDGFLHPSDTSAPPNVS